MTTLPSESVTAWRDSTPVSPPTEIAGEAAAALPVGDRVRLAMVDDDDDYREAMAAELENLGFLVTSWSDGPSLIAAFAGGVEADVIVLDWKLQASLGIDLLPQLRRRGIMLPVIFLTGMPATTYESLALERGALDFVDKSRGAAILARRIRLIAEARKTAGDVPPEDVIEQGRLQLRPRVSRAYWDGIDVNLTITEFNIVHLLLRRLGDYVSYREIYDCVHRTGFIAGSGEDGYRANVRSSVKRIRNKFRSIDAEFSEIENFPAFGYSWSRIATRPT